MDVIKEYKQILLDIIHKKLPKCKVYLFGSRGTTKDHQSGSDVDLALDAGKPIKLSIIFARKEEIEETTIPVFVDVIDINNSSKDFVDEIKKDWIPWTN